MITAISAQQRQLLHFALVPLLSGGVAWLAFIVIGDTPLIRATGLALVIVGVALTLRTWGAILSVIGSLVLAFGPAFWSQTGGQASTGLAGITLALLGASLVAAVFFFVRQRPYLALTLGMVVFAIVFWSQVGTPRSLRLTSLLAAWLMFLLVEAIRISNPRPEEPPAVPVAPHHAASILLILAVGVLNDPLFVLLVPAVMMGLWLSRTLLPWWYWLSLVLILVVGARGIALTYIDSGWWGYDSVAAQERSLQVPYAMIDGLRAGERWVDLIDLVFRQITVVGAALSVIGLARMARWYPVLGVVTMIGYGFYAAFGLVYFGADRQVLLLPMFIIQIIWLTYAIHAFGQWVSKGVRTRPDHAYRLAVAAYILLPLYLAANVA